MSRQASPLLHDYKPSAAAKPKKSKALQWFAVGLGLPLLGLALLSSLDSSDTTETPATTVAEARAPDGEQVSIDDIAVAASTAPELATPAPQPEPEFANLELKISRGDTMEKLFRKHDLDLGHLAQISRLEEARSRFRKLQAR